MSLYPRHRWVVLGAIASLMLATGCPTGTQVPVKDPVTTATNGQGGGLGAQVASANSIKGKVTMPSTYLSADGKSPAKYELAAITNYKAVVGAEVTIRSPRMLNMPNTGKGTTDGTGAYNIKGIPVGQVMYVVAQYGDVLAASIAFIPEPELKKEAGRVIVPPPVEKTVNIDLATTVAAAGLLPLFLDADGNVPNELNDLRVEDWDKLVEATAAALNDSFTFKPTKKLADMEPYFRTLRSDPTVNQAYLRIEGYLQAAMRARYGGGGTGTPKPATSTDPSASPSTGASTSPSPGASSSASPSASPSASVAPKTYDAVMVLKSEVTTVAGNTGTNQMAVITGLGMLVPCGDRIRLYKNDGTAGPELVAGENGVPAFSEAFGIATKDSKAYMVARIGGNFSIITIDMANPLIPDITSKQLTGVTVQSAAAVVVSSAPSGATQNKVLLSDDVRQVIFAIDPTSGAAQVYSGSLDSSNGAEAGGMIGVDKFFYNDPNCIAIDSTNHKLYVADANKNRIVELDLVAGTGRTLTGTVLGDDKGTLAQAKMKKPSAVYVGTNGRIWVGDTNNHAIRQVKITEDENIYLSTVALEAITKGMGLNLIQFPKAVTQLGSDVYAIDNTGKIQKFDLGEGGT